MEQRKLDLELFEKTLVNGLKNKDPKSSLAWAMKLKKTIRVGNKSDSYQMLEMKEMVTRRALHILMKMEWSFVIQTKFTQNVERDLDIFLVYPQIVQVMPVISPGLDRDWELFERKLPAPPEDRLEFLTRVKKCFITGGVNGEPFIPGYHTIKDFRNAILLLKKHGIKSYNTYHLHMNDLVAKNLHALGLDIEKIWWANQDDQWRPVLRQLIDIAKEHDIVLGCPDFVNSGEYQEISNTCCGINVPNPCTFNAPTWKKEKQKGFSTDIILSRTYDGIGNYEEGRAIIDGTAKDMYTLKDIK